MLIKKLPKNSHSFIKIIFFILKFLFFTLIRQNDLETL